MSVRPSPGVSVRSRSKNGGSFVVDVKFQRRHLKSATFAMKDVGVAWGNDALAAAQRGEPLPEPVAYGAVVRKPPPPAPVPIAPNTESPSVAEAAQRYKVHYTRRNSRSTSGDSIKLHKRIIDKYIVPYFADTECAASIGRMTVEQVGDFVDHIAKQPNGRGGTIGESRAQAILGALRALLRFSRDMQWLTHDPSSNINVHPDPKTGEDSEWARLDLSLVLLILAKVPREYWMAVLLMRYCGLRQAEAFGVRIVNIHLGDRLIFVCEQAGVRRRPLPGDEETVLDVKEGTKGPAYQVLKRWVPIPPSLVPFIEAWIRLYHTDRATGIQNEQAFLCDTGSFAYHYGVHYLQVAWVKALEESDIGESDIGARTNAGDHRATLRCLRFSLGSDGQNDPRIPDPFVSHLLGHKLYQERYGDPKRAATVTRRHYGTKTDLTQAEKEDLAQMGVLFEDAMLRNSPRGDIIPSLLAALEAPRSEPEGLTPHEAAVVLGLNGRTIYDWIHRRVFDDVRLVRCGKENRILIPGSEVERIRRRIVGHVSLTNLSEELGLTKGHLRKRAKTAHFALVRIGNADFMRNADAEAIITDVGRSRAERNALFDFAEAAHVLGISERAVGALVDIGCLDEYGDASLFGRRLVTVASVQAYKASFAPPGEGRSGRYRDASGQFGVQPMEAERGS